MLLEGKKVKFPKFPSFRFCVITRIENLEILEDFLFIQNLEGVVTQMQKNKKLTRKQLGGQDMFLVEKVKICNVFFGFCPIPKIQNSEILESAVLLQILTVGVT